MDQRRILWRPLFIALCSFGWHAPAGRADEDNQPRIVAADVGEISRLPVAESNRVAKATDRGLAYLAAQQETDGSFPTYRTAQPGVTGLCVLAFLASGRLPGEAEFGSFRYAAGNPQVPWHATNGAGILALSLGGRHASAMARSAGDWILARPIQPYNGPHIEMYHYAAFYCSMGMLHLGGSYWNEFFPALARELVDHQLPDGAWQGVGSEARWGKCFTTALAVLALAAPNQLIPVYQR